MWPRLSCHGRAPRDRGAAASLKQTRSERSGDIPMDYTHLGRTGLKVSRIALGTMNFGELTDEAISFSIMGEAPEAGINFVDTAAFMAAFSHRTWRKATARPRRSSAIGLCRIASAATGSCWRPRSISRWRPGRTTSGCEMQLTLATGLEAERHQLETESSMTAILGATMRGSDNSRYLDRKI